MLVAVSGNGLTELDPFCDKSALIDGEDSVDSIVTAVKVGKDVLVRDETSASNKDEVAVGVMVDELFSKAIILMAISDTTPTSPSRTNSMLLLREGLF